MEEKDNQRFSESRLAEELFFRIYDNKRDIIVQLTDVERGWELKRKDSMQMRNSILGISIETSQLTSIKGELKPKIELISFDSQSDEILDFRRYLC